MWTEQDVQAAVLLVEQPCPSLEGCSLDKGYHSMANRERLDAKLELNVLSEKGQLSKAEQERESAPAFQAARR